MSLITTSSHHSDLLPGLVKKWFSVNPNTVEALYDKILKVESSTNAYEVHATNTGFSTLVAKPEGSAIALDTTQEGIKPIYTNVTYALGFAITMEAMEDGNVFKDAKKHVEGLKRAGMVTREVIAANVYNYAGTSGHIMTQGDGVILASASHPTAAGNQSNILASAADLSEAALEAIRTQIENAKDNRGIRIPLMIKDLIVSPDQRADAYRILQSERRVGTADNDANFLKGTGVIKNVIVNRYLTSTTQWQVTTTIEDGLKFLNRKELQIDADNDFMTKQGLYSVVMRCCAGWDDFRGAYFSL